MIDSNERMAELKISDYLIKPVKRHELIKKIKEVLSKRENDFNEEIEKSNKSILIVEDNIINMNVMESILNKIGNYEILKANNGLKALEILKTKDIDIIFMDIQMPVMNGFEAFKEIKKLSIENTIKLPKVIAMTAYAMNEDKDKCLSVGMNDFVSKPFKIKDIQKVLQEMNI